MDVLRRRLHRARIYLVCDNPTDDLLEGALRGGVDVVQLRMKAAGEARILAAAERVGSACRRHGVLFILNDRPDLVVPAQADGVHVGQDDMPVAEVRALLGASPLIGLSTHSELQVGAAGGGTVDYIGVGPVHATPTKPRRSAVGLGLVAYAARRATVPFFAIGGIGPENIGAVRAAGATRVAVVRALVNSPDPAGTARELRAALESPPVRVQEAGVGPA